MIHRFYGLSRKDVNEMPEEEFKEKIEEISNVLKLETGEGEGEGEGEQKETSLTGNAGFALAKTIFPKGKT